MLSFKGITNSGGAAHYFENTDDYYAKEGHRGEWQGEGAKELGLEGKVNQDDFKKLLDGYLNTTGEKVRNSKATNSKDRKGIDFTLSAPKSVSIQALINGDERILKAHDEAVKTTMKAMEKLAVARKKEKNISFREHTNKLVIASFRHELSRAQDPQLHTHNIVMNLTQREDGQWRALSNEEMLDNVKVLGALYKSELAQNMQSLGYELRETKKGWELAHVDDAAIKLFSKRSNEIEKRLELDGDDRESVSGKYKQNITLGTRPRKTEEDRLTLHQEWVRSAKEAKVSYEPKTTIKGMIYKQYGESKKTIKENFLGIKASESAFKEREKEAYKSIEYAVSHLTERQGIINKSEVLAVAYEHGAIRTSVEDINNALNRAKKNELIIAEVPLYQSARSMSEASGKNAKNSNGSVFKINDEAEKLTFKSWVSLTMASRGLSEDKAEKSVKSAITRGVLVKTEERFVTKEAKKTEISILAIERVGRGSVSSISDKDKIDKMLEMSDLNQGQKDAVNLILTSDNRFIGVQGTAGTGKSHMLSKTVDEIKKNALLGAQGEGYKVIGLAPYASQNRALEQLGMESKTLASFLKGEERAKKSQLDSRSIVILDEASVVPAREMLQLMRVIEKNDARLVLNGDIKQTQAVEAGKPFEQLQNSGMSLAYLTEIKRQKNKRIKLAVLQAASDNVPKAVEALQKNIIEIKDNDKRYEQIALRYASLSPKDRAETLIVAGTNEARLKINLSVREKLGVKGGEEVKILTGVDMTKAQAKEVRNFDVDMIVIAPGRIKNGMSADEQYVIKSINSKNNEIAAMSKEGKEIIFDPSKIEGLRAFNQESIPLQKNEWVKVTNNNKALDLRNGERYQVLSNDKDKVILKTNNGNVSLDKKEALHLQYGYATTVHSSQGLTSDRVLIDADVNSKTSNKAVFYVAISRPRNGLDIYTNGASKLSESMNREPKKYAALEMRDNKKENEILDIRLQGVAIKQLKENIKPREQSVSVETKQTRNVKKFMAEIKPKSNQEKNQKTFIRQKSRNLEL